MAESSVKARDDARATSGAPPASFGGTETDTFNPHWMRNLWVCFFGSFTTIVAMTLLLPFLPLYVEQLGVKDPASIARWSGVAFGATFLTAAMVSPLWGRMADRYGRKLMMIRASLGMAIAMPLIGLATDVWQLVALRLLAGLLGGYSSGSMILVATQTPKARVGWALGTLSSGIMAGNLAGPLIGGVLPPLIGIRETFFAAGGFIFIAFLATVFIIKEAAPRRPGAADKSVSARGEAAPVRAAGWAAIPDRRPVIAMLATGMLLMFANMSIEPIITIYVAQVTPHAPGVAPGASQITFWAGLTMSAAALGSMLSASRLGKLADRVGHWNVIVGCLVASAVLLIPQAFVTDAWQLVGLRFLMGLALGGLLPCVASVIRHRTPSHVTGGMLGYSTSSQYAGQVAGPLAGGFIGGLFGMRSVFIGTAVLMAAGAMYNRIVSRQYPHGVGGAGQEPR